MLTTKLKEGKVNLCEFMLVLARVNRRLVYTHINLYRGMA